MVFSLNYFWCSATSGPVLLDFLPFKLFFSWPATVIAAVAVSFPLMYRSALTAFEQMDSELLAVAQTLGFSESRYFRKIALPLSMNGLLAGGVLALPVG